MSNTLLTWLLTAEVLVLALAFVSFFYVRGSKAKDVEHKAVSALIKKLNNKWLSRQDEVLEFGELPAIDDDALTILLDDIHKKEASLYQHIVKIFLQKEAAHLKSLDKHVSALSEPYWGVIKGLASQDGTGLGGNEPDVEVKAALTIALDEKARLSAQLASALETLDDVSAEYTRMFSSSRDIDDLLESKEIMLSFYRQALSADTTKVDDKDDIPVAYERVESI